jgi:hypothetical protein
MTGAAEMSHSRFHQDDPGNAGGERQDGLLTRSGGTM